MHLEFNFRRSKCKNFSWGSMPPDPLAWSTLMCAQSHCLTQSYWPLHITKASVAPVSCLASDPTKLVSYIGGIDEINDNHELSRGL